LVGERGTKRCLQRRGGKRRGGERSKYKISKIIKIKNIDKKQVKW